MDRYIMPGAQEKKSEFNGGLLGLIGIRLLQFVIIVLTLTLGMAWASVKYEKWYAKHTKIDGKQMVFTGTGWQLFGNYIKWFWLTIITIGIYAFWLGIKREKWRVKHITLEDIPPVAPFNPYMPYPVNGQQGNYAPNYYYNYPPMQQ